MFARHPELEWKDSDMSQTPDQPSTPETPDTPVSPVTTSSTQQFAAPATGTRRSVWREAVSTTGGKLAVIVAAASLGVAALLVVGLVAVGFARHFGGDHGDVAGMGDSRQMPQPNGDSPGRQGPQHMPRGQLGPRQMGPGQGRGGASDLPGPGLPGPHAALHGEAVIPGQGTATQTVLFQRGEVTAVTTDTLTVKSTDGFSATYTIGADSRDRLKKKVSTLTRGQRVSVVATKDSATTLRIITTGRSGSTS